LGRIKAAYSASRYIGSTVRVWEGMGTKGSKHRPFDAERAVRAFTHWAYAASMLNANAVASVPLRLYTRRRSGAAKHYATRPVGGYMKEFFAGRAESKPRGKVFQKAAEFGADIEEVIEPHPALELLQIVNPWQNGCELTELRIIDQQLTGNSYFHVVLHDELKVPTEIWRMPPQWTRVIPSPTNFIAGYLYGQSSDVEQTYPADEVIQFKMPNPRDVHYGMGNVEAGWKVIGLDAGKREQDTAKVDNYSRPDWAIIAKTGNKDTLDRIEAKVEEKFKGAHKAGQFAAFVGDIELKALQWEEKEYGTPTRVIEEIAAVWGTPVAMLLSNDPNRANSEASRLGWYRNTIRPFCTRDAEKLNEKLLPMFGEAADDLMYCYDHVCFEDRAALVKEQVGLVAGGIRTANEARSWLGDPPSDDPTANRLYPPSGNAGTSGTTGDTAVGQNDERNNE
jgi:phage portal protein BeeE